MSINLILQKNCLDDGVHHNERFLFIEEIAKMICKWRFARLFAECIDKIFYDPSKQPRSVEELAFEQLVTRIEIYLKNISFGNAKNKNNFGLLIHDNNPTVAKKLTDLIKAHCG